ncbi:MAG: ribonuclease HII [Clostridiales bacterium]|nr:ribonuclease HII [Clostridiales bacterium]
MWPERLRIEGDLWSQGYRLVAGLDEAGRGPLAGPLVVAAVILPPEWHHPEIQDSKKLSPKERARLAEIIRQAALSYSLVTVAADVIDTVGLSRAWHQAVRAAVRRLSLPPQAVLVDGTWKPALEVPFWAIPGGDDRSQTVAAASILAKVYRDHLMALYHRRWPQYGFDRHMGYGTREHRDAIRRYGPSPIHRWSFRWEGTLPS